MSPINAKAKLNDQGRTKYAIITRPIETVIEPHISIGLRYCPIRPIINPINVIDAITEMAIISRGGVIPQKESSCSTAASEIKRLKLMRYLSSFIAAIDEGFPATIILRKMNSALRHAPIYSPRLAIHPVLLACPDTSEYSPDTLCMEHRIYWSRILPPAGLSSEGSR